MFDFEFEVVFEFAFVFYKPLRAANGNSDKFELSCSAYMKTSCREILGLASLKHRVNKSERRRRKLRKE